MVVLHCISAGPAVSSLLERYWSVCGDSGSTFFLLSFAKLYFQNVYTQSFPTWVKMTDCDKHLAHPSISFFPLPHNPFSPGEICAFNIHGLDAPFEAVVLNGTSGEGQLRARGLVDCELQKEYTFIIQAHDCGSGPRGTEGKKSHKWVNLTPGLE